MWFGEFGDPCGSQSKTAQKCPARPVGERMEDIVEEVVVSEFGHLVNQMVDDFA